MDIAKLFNKYHLDRASYIRVYEGLFTPEVCDKIKTVLEIGIGSMIPGVHSSMADNDWPTKRGYRAGNGLRMWKELLPHAQIYGIDVQPDTQIKEPGIQTALCDSTNKEAADKFFESVGGATMDVIVDDGSHIRKDQLKTMANFYRYLSIDGIYIIEDIGLEIIGKDIDTVREICCNDPLTLGMGYNGLALIITRRK